MAKLCLAISTLLLALTVGAGGVPAAAASGSDARATHAYLLAQYRLIGALLHDGSVLGRAESSTATQIARECPGVVAGMPPEPSLFPAPPPRVRGENARLNQEKQTIDEELDAAVSQPSDSLYRPAEEAWAAEVRRLSWSNPAITSEAQAEIAAMLEGISAAAPPFCADARAWAQSGYRALSASSRQFEASRAARLRGDREEGSLDTLLKPDENAADRALLRKTRAAEFKLLASAATAYRATLRTKRALGFPRDETREPPKQITLGHGRTAAGTRFSVSSGPGLLGAGSGPCRRWATVAYTRPNAPEPLIVGGPNNPICLSPPRYRRPEVFCEAGIETIQTAVPASVRSAGLLLADGRTIRSRVIRAARRGQSLAGIYAQELRGSTSHAVSLVELNAGEGAVLTLKLPRYRCVKPRTEPEEIPTTRVLAGGHTPEGEPFTISAFGSINGEPFLSVDTGVDPELDEIAIGIGPGSSKTFPWSLRIGCSPHPYAILFAILLPPGESVVAQTSRGPVALNVVPVETRVHATGPLAYGVFSALPSELTVLGANGSILYTENLQAKAAEAVQFCEGYAEP